MSQIKVIHTKMEKFRKKSLIMFVPCERTESAFCENMSFHDLYSLAVPAEEFYGLKDLAKTKRSITLGFLPGKISQ